MDYPSVTHEGRQGAPRAAVEACAGAVAAHEAATSCRRPGLSRPAPWQTDEPHHAQAGFAPHGTWRSDEAWLSLDVQGLAAETTHHPNHVVEQALAHAIGSGVEAAYRRGDLFAKRVALMNDWARYLERDPAKVVLLVSRRRSDGPTAGLGARSVARASRRSTGA